MIKTTDMRNPVRLQCQQKSKQITWYWEPEYSHQIHNRNQKRIYSEAAHLIKKERKRLTYLISQNHTKGAISSL